MARATLCLLRQEGAAEGVLGSVLFGEELLDLLRVSLFLTLCLIVLGN